MTTKQVIDLADKTSDAQSYSTYGQTEWRRAIRLLDARGFDARSIEAILRSKWTRWAADATMPRRVLAGNLIAWMDTPRNHSRNAELLKEVAKLVKETFGTTETGADLAGQASGEDIADLIDFARRVAKLKTMPFTKLSSDASAILARIDGRTK